MKFTHRLGMISSVSGFSVLLVLLVYSQGRAHAPNAGPPVPGRMRRRALLVDYEMDQQSPWRSGYQHDQCRHQLLHSEASMNTNNDNSTIFTIELPEKTSYQINSNKRYNFPRTKVSDTDGKKLNVIIVPHSHVDAGWLRTVDEYYVYHVKGILNNMVKKLYRYPDMKFVWAETVFLAMWWNEIDDDVKIKVRQLIKREQLEIALGGWVMSDEASTHYVSVLDQLMEGHRWVKSNLKTSPVNSWSIDPFGHSATMAYLWKQSGMKNMVIQRVHQAIKATLANEKSLEFKWRQLWDYDGNSDILCHIMPYVYYGIQHSCGPDRQVCAMYDYGLPKSIYETATGRLVTDDNIEKQATYLYDQYRKKAALFKYNTVLVPLGDDFRFDKAEEWDLHYDNYMKIMEYINGKPEWNMNVQFGTLKDYFNAARHDERFSTRRNKNAAFPVLKGDFFPYSDIDSEYWTGYYSTRPFQKQLSRDVESSLRSADILATMAHAQCVRLNTEYENFLEIMSQLQKVRRTLGLFLHHDAITGTSKPEVVQDYEQKLLQAYGDSQTVISSAVQNILTSCSNDDPLVISTNSRRKDLNSPPTKYTIAVTEGGTKVFFFNPVAQYRTEYVTIKTDSANIKIRNSQNENIPFQINPIFKHTTKIHDREFEIVFQTVLPAFAIETYTIYKVDERSFGFWSTVETYNIGKITFPEEAKFQYTHSDRLKTSNIENDYLQAHFDVKGMLNSINYKLDNRVLRTKLNFLAYKSEASGAYLFYPSGEAIGILDNIEPQVKLIKGPFMEQITVVYKHLRHSVTVYDTPAVQGQGLHIRNVLDMSAQSLSDQEVIMRVDSDVTNQDGVFFTDENGFQLIGRQTRHDARVETNYYPVTTMALLENNDWRLTLHSQQSHGAASLKPGQLEVMLDRHVDHDDNRGLGEGVTDNRPTVSNFMLQIERRLAVPGSNDAARHAKFTHPSIIGHVMNGHLQQPVKTLFTTVNHNVFQSSFHPLSQPLPCDHSIVGFKTLVSSDISYNGTSVTVHRKGFNCQFPTSGLQCTLERDSFQLNTLFPNNTIIASTETSLTHLHSKGHRLPNLDIHLDAMNLKSFLLTL